MQKKNNKGFSLVELIVVVLIMAIIAVALAPQVTKWVENSRQATDIQTKDSVVSAFQMAALDKDVNGNAISVTITKDSVTWSPENSTVQSKINAIYKVSDARCKSAKTTITVSMSAVGVVSGNITGVNGELK